VWLIEIRRQAVHLEKRIPLVRSGAASVRDIEQDVAKLADLRAETWLFSTSRRVEEAIEGVLASSYEWLYAAEEPPSPPDAMDDYGGTYSRWSDSLARLDLEARAQLTGHRYRWYHRLRERLRRGPHG
jgi:hypothetical protein